MALHIITYDLHNQRTYEPVWNYLQRIGAIRILASVWLVDSNLTAGDIANALNQVIDGDDSYSIIQLFPGANWAVLRPEEGTTQWLRAHVTR